MMCTGLFEERLRHWSWGVLLLLTLALTWGAGVAQAEEGPVVRMVYFYANDCPPCIAVINEVLQPLQKRHGDQMQIKMVEISDPANYEMLVRAEETFDVAPEERRLPTLVIDGQALIGEDDVRERLPCLLDTCLGAGGTSWPAIPGLEETTAEGEGWPDMGFDPGGEGLKPCDPEETEVCEGPAPIYAAYFYEVGCRECSHAEYDIRYVQSKYPQLLVEEYNVQDDTALAEWLDARFDVPEEQRMAMPALFVGEDYLTGSEITSDALLELVEKYVPTGVERAWADFDPHETEAQTTAPARADDGEPVVHAILFYSPSCPHCHQVIQEVLPPLAEHYGEQLQIAGVDTYTPEGSALYHTAIEHFQIPEERRGVPTLIIGDVVLVGSVEIPEQLPGLIEQGLAAGGVDWPAIPDFVPPAAPTPEAVATPVPTGVTDATPPPTVQATPVSGLAFPAEPPSSIGEIIARDMPGNAISIGILFGMVLSVGYVMIDGVHVWRRKQSRRRRKSPKSGPKHASSWRDWAVLALCLLGLGVASYLAYVETTLTEAVCGPVGDCNTVQQSEYALLFGLIPIAVLGVVGYVCILAVLVWKWIGRGWLVELTPVALLGLTLFGTGFSIYLTFLEPFVIGATCAWCLTSAVSMTLLMLLVAKPGWETLKLKLSSPAKTT